MPLWGSRSGSKRQQQKTAAAATDNIFNNNNNGLKEEEPVGGGVEENGGQPEEDVTPPASTSRRTKSKKETAAPPLPPPPTSPPPPPSSQLIQRPKLVFHCQQAHGSPTGIISGFTSIKELYDKIAQCYDFPASEILFCTLNTHKVEMDNLLGGQIGLEDFIFAHRKGQKKEVELTKEEDALGLTITDNGAGYCFIKKIRENSVIEKANYIHVGDHIEKIDNINLVGKKHFEVAKMLKEIPRGTTFIIRLVEPLRDGFGNIGKPKSSGNFLKKGYGSGKATIRLKSNGPAIIEEAPDDLLQTALTKIDNLLESFMGINDAELATQIWELGMTIKNPIDFCEQIDNSELSDFGFTQDFIFDLWGIVNDAKAGRLQRNGT